MHVDVTRSDLARVLSAVARIVETRGLIPALSNVVLTASENKIVARGTDLNVEMTAWSDATVNEPGEACVPANKIADIVRAMVGETVSLDLEAGKAAGTGTLTVKCGRSRFKLPSTQASVVPTIAVENYSHTFRANIGQLLARVDFAVGVEGVGKTTPSMEGICVVVEGEHLRAISLNGAELAYYDIARPDGLADDMPPMRIAKRLAGIIRGIEGDVDVSVQRDRIKIDMPNAQIVAKMIEGTFYDYKRVLPKPDDGALVRASKPDLAGAVSRSALVADADKGAAVKLQFSADAVAVTAADKDGRDGADEAPVELVSGEPIAVGFASPLLLGLLRAVPGDSLELRVRVGGFTTITCAEDPTFYAVIAPYRI